MPLADLSIIQNPERLSVLRALHLLDTQSEPAFDRLTHLASRILNKPVALVSLVDFDRQFFKSQIGLPESWASAQETPLSHSFCQHVVATGDVLIIEDARQHPLVYDNLAIPDLNVIAYAGIPLTTAAGQTLGSFCVMDSQPHEWADDEIAILRDLAASVITEIELLAELLNRQENDRKMRESQDRYRIVSELSADYAYAFRVEPDGTLVREWTTDAFAQITGYTTQDLDARGGWDAVIHPDDRLLVSENLIHMLKTGERSSLEYRIVTQAGVVRFMHGILRPFWDAESGRVTRVFGSSRDITEQKQAEDTVRKSMMEMGIIRRVDSELTKKLDVDYVVSLALDIAVRLSNAERGFIALSEEGMLRLKQVVGKFESLPDPSTLSDASLQAVRMQRPELVLAADDRVQQIIIPLIAGSRTIGLLDLESDKSSMIKRESFELVQMIAARIAVALENARLYAIAQRQVMELQALYDQQAYQAEHDLLTGLANRTLFEKSLTQAMEDAAAAGKLVAVMFIDLDRFKQINDTLGHAAGDTLLQEVAGRMTVCVHEGDTVARMGGDEFTIALRDINSQAEGIRVAECILEALNQPVRIEHHSLTVTGSVGISFFPADGTVMDDLLRRADSALYRAKQTGRNTFQLAIAGEEDTRLKQLKLENALRSAIVDQQLELHYQPQFNLNTEQIIGMEALVRWQHPELGLVSPGEFIPIAEASGLIIPIGAWVLNEACRQANEWRALGYNLTMAVNVSALQLEQADFPDWIAGVLKLYDLPPEALEIEITETMLVQDIDKKFERLMQIALLGVGIAIDDFGTGYSSMRYLQNLPITSLKIDRAFVADIGDDPARTAKATAIIHAITAVVHNLGLTVVAEGVETEQQVAVLRSVSADALQGYLFGKPMAPDALQSLLSEKARRLE